MLLHAKHITLWLLFAVMCTSCTGVHDLRDARSIVAKADSLRAAGQVPYTLNRSNSSNLSNGSLPSDSTALAFTVTTLEPVRLLFPTDYAHANYYYGRLLREAGDHPEAMLAFLRAVHSRTKDHVIKARSWSNIANMCRIAEMHELACDVLNFASKEFLLGCDTLLYYYSLNDKAVDLAENMQKDEAIRLTNQIERECKNYGVLTKVWETRAIIYTHSEQYDSVLYYVDLMQKHGYAEPTGLLLKSRALRGLGEKDSSVYYAQQVAERTHSWFDLNNAYFILANDDVSKSKEEALQVTQDRSDIQKLIKIRHGQLTQAVQLLQQDLSRKPDLTWLWTLLATLIIVAIPLSIYIQKQKSKRQLYSQQVEDLQHKQDVLSEQNLQLEQQYTLRQEKVLAEIKSFCDGINMENIKEVLCWKDYDAMCTIVNKRMYGLVDKLKSRGITSDKEIRICIVVVIGHFDTKQMADMVPTSYNSFKSAKSFVVKKLHSSAKNLRSDLLNIAVGC